MAYNRYHTFEKEIEMPLRIKKIYLAILILCICYVLFWNSFKSYKQEQTDYAKAVEIFEEIQISDIEQLQESGSAFYLYVGRESCPYCQKFVLELHRLVLQEEIRMYYLDSVDTYENSDLELREFRDQYGISTVPSLIVLKGYEKIADFAYHVPNETEEDVIDFLHLYSKDP